jgi:hypothetical protein
VLEDGKGRKIRLGYLNPACYISERPLVLSRIYIAQQNQTPDGKGVKEKDENDLLLGYKNPEKVYCLPTS